MKKMAIITASLMILTIIGSAISVSAANIGYSAISVSAANRTYVEDGHIIGVVEDHSGNPLEGVMVIAWGDEIDQTYTNKDGEFDLSVKAGSYLVRFRCSGYIGNFVWVNELERGEIRDLGIVRLLKAENSAR